MDATCRALSRYYRLFIGVRAIDDNTMATMFDRAVVTRRHHAIGDECRSLKEASANIMLLINGEEFTVGTASVGMLLSRQ